MFKFKPFRFLSKAVFKRTRNFHLDSFKYSLKQLNSCNILKTLPILPKSMGFNSLSVNPGNKFLYSRYLNKPKF